MRIVLFRLQKYKKFESNSQHHYRVAYCDESCFDCKSTKNLRAIHNLSAMKSFLLLVVSTAKVQKIWEQFTTVVSVSNARHRLFRLQKYKKFESNSQPNNWIIMATKCCFDCKSTKNLRAIHNRFVFKFEKTFVVSTAKVQKIWEQFTTKSMLINMVLQLFRLQKYKKFESNSQLDLLQCLVTSCCFDCKSTKNLRAIHNSVGKVLFQLGVVSTAKVQKIWEQFTTVHPLHSVWERCFDCKSTKNLRAIHNYLCKVN